MEKIFNFVKAEFEGWNKFERIFFPVAIFINSLYNRVYRINAVNGRSIPVGLSERVMYAEIHLNVRLREMHPGASAAKFSQ